MFRRQGKVAGAPRCMGMEVINYKYSDRQLVADKNIDEVLERTWSRLGSNKAQNKTYAIRLFFRRRGEL